MSAVADRELSLFYPLAIPPHPVITASTNIKPLFRKEGFRFSEMELRD